MRYKEDGFEIDNKNWRKIHKNFHSNNVIRLEKKRITVLARLTGARS